MGLIKQEPLKKVKETEQTIILTDDLVRQINEYCTLAGIARGVERNGEAKTSIEARREYFILKAIERILDEDQAELDKLRTQEDLEEAAPEVVVKRVLDEGIQDIIDSL